MRSILLLNPNTSAATTDMMAAAARSVLPPGIALRGITAGRGPAMITNEAALADSVAEVVRLGTAQAGGHDALVVAAFGDPGVAQLRRSLTVPVIGIGEASIREAAGGGRQFGIITMTPGLVSSIMAHVRSLKLDAGFTGVRVPGGDPVALAADPDRQAATLLQAVSVCLTVDGADVVVIGGGPLSDTAAELARRVGDRIIEPVPAAIHWLLQTWGAS